MRDIASHRPSSRPNADSAVLQRVAWSKLRRRVAQELKHRQIHTPVVSAFRWWARRPHSAMGAILDAAIDKYGRNIRVGDPFSGGGTVAIEAIRRGVKAYAQDIHAWPAKGLSTAIRYCRPEKFRTATRELQDALAPLRGLYLTEAGTELSHVLRVRTAICTTCAEHSFLFSGPMVSLQSRAADNKHAYFGCGYCGAISRRLRNVRSFSCDQCERRAKTDRAETGCAHCGDENLERTGYWHPILVQELIEEGGRIQPILRPPRLGDPISALPAGETHPALAEAIPSGVETRRLLDAGFNCWGDLYTDRQAQTLLRAIEVIEQIKAGTAVKDRLAYAVIGAAEMPAFLSRWDRFHLKAFEAMANHRFAHSNVAVEANLLAPVGRGTIPKRLRAAINALDWLAKVETGPPRVFTRMSESRSVSSLSKCDVLVATGSSRSQPLPARSVNIVITDPPYYDYVQYAELAGVFHAWLKAYSPAIHSDDADEAVPNTQRGTTPQDYEDTIAACLTESRRVLRRNGRLVLTFHNKKLAAWNALAGALRTAGFTVEAIAVVLAENASDHCKRSVRAMLHDLVIECAPARKTPAARVHVAFVPRTSAEKNLAAMGLAVADFVRGGTTLELAALFEKQLARLRASRRLIA